MANFSPDIVFTNPTMANQLVRLSDLDAAQRNRNQMITLSQLDAAANRQARERESNNRNALQYAALMNQDRQHTDESATRERMLESQLKNQRDMLQSQIEANKEIARLNPWGKGGADVFLGGAQLNSSIDQANKEAEAEAAQLNSQLDIYNQEHSNRALQYNPSIYSRALHGVGSFFDLNRSNDEMDRDFGIQNDADLNQKIQNLMGSAKKSYFDPYRRRFMAIQRTGIAMPGQPGQPAPAPAPAPAPYPVDTTPYVPPPAALDLTNPGLGYHNFGDRFAPVPWLDRAQQPGTPMPTAPSDSLDSIRSDYIKGLITDDDVVRRAQALGL